VHGTFKEARRRVSRSTPGLLAKNLSENWS
jgi:hypothetical protein